MDSINIYTDGGYRSSVGVGAYAYTLEYKGHSYDAGGASVETTNNKEELKAVIYALKRLKTEDIPVKVYTDSKYVIGCAVDWIDKWRGNNYHKKGGLKNRELVIELDKQVQRQGDIEFIHVKGHSGVEGNEKVDALVNKLMDDFIAQMDDNEFMEYNTNLLND